MYTYLLYSYNLVHLKVHTHLSTFRSNISAHINEYTYLPGEHMIGLNELRSVCMHLNNSKYLSFNKLFFFT